MSGQKIHPFHCGPFFILFFSIATFCPLHGSPVDRRSGVQGSGWPGGGFSGPLWILIGNRDEHAESSGIVEWQERDLYLSGFFKTDAFEVYGGRRELPGRTLFYADSEHPPGFLPPRRRDDLIFFKLFPDWLLPGIFSAKHLSGPGLYVCFRDAFFFGYHPSVKIWGITGRTSFQRVAFVMDMEGEKKEYQGYASFRWTAESMTDGARQEEHVEDTASAFFKLEGERRPYWDRFRYREERYDEPENTALGRDETDRSLDVSDRDIANDRRYRSFSSIASAVLGPLSILAGGMDRGDVAFRIVTFGRNVPNDPGWYGLVEVSALQMQLYREDAVSGERRLGIGLARRGRLSLFESIFRVGDSPSIGLELRGSFRSETAIPFSMQPMLILSSSERIDTFEYFSGVSSTDGQARFIERARYAFGMRLRSDSVRAVLLFTGRRTEKGAIKEWGYLRLEYQKRF